VRNDQSEHYQPECSLRYLRTACYSTLAQKILFAIISQNVRYDTYGQSAIGPSVATIQPEWSLRYLQTACYDQSDHYQAEWSLRYLRTDCYSALALSVRMVATIRTSYSNDKRNVLSLNIQFSVRFFSPFRILLIPTCEYESKLRTKSCPN